MSRNAFNKMIRRLAIALGACLLLGISFGIYVALSSHAQRRGHAESFSQVPFWEEKLKGFDPLIGGFDYIHRYPVRRIDIGWLYAFGMPRKIEYGVNYAQMAVSDDGKETINLLMDSQPVQYEKFKALASEISGVSEGFSASSKLYSGRFRQCLIRVCRDVKSGKVLLGIQSFDQSD